MDSIPNVKSWHKVFNALPVKLLTWERFVFGRYPFLRTTSC